MWKNALLFASLLLSFFLAVALLILVPIPKQGELGNPTISYTDFISITLTAVTIILAVFGLMVAYIAFLGRQEIERRACEVAAKKAEETILNNPNIQELVRSLSDGLRHHVDGKIKEEGNKLYSDIVATTAVVDLSVPPDAKEDTND